MISFLKEHNLITLPGYLGPFQIRQLPDAFKPTSPGGFMNPPGVYDKDPSGFYFIPTYNPQSKNFYIRAAIEDPRPILGHEGIPGHFLDRKSTRLNSSHTVISYAVFCLKKKNTHPVRVS